MPCLLADQGMVTLLVCVQTSGPRPTSEKRARGQTTRISTPGAQGNRLLVDLPRVRRELLTRSLGSRGTGRCGACICIGRRLMGQTPCLHSHYCYLTRFGLPLFYFVLCAIRSCAHFANSSVILVIMTLFQCFVVAMVMTASPAAVAGQIREALPLVEEGIIPTSRQVLCPRKRIPN